MIARLGGLVLLALGAASGWFALAGNYTVLMNPTFRWVTIAGSLLLLAMGAVQIGSTRGGSKGSLIVFGIFFGVVAWARPETGGVAPLLMAAGGMPSIEREGYEPFDSRRLFETLDQEAAVVPAGRIVMRGFVKRLPELDTTGTFVLLQPQMACCLADVLALGVRVRVLDGALPKDGTWVHVFGELRALGSPVQTPSFRVGAILFVAVSRVHRLAAHEVVTHQSLLEDLYEKTPSARCALFRQLVTDSGLLETLQDRGPFTVFVPLDVAFERMPKKERDALFSDPQRMRRVVESLIAPGRLSESDLYRSASLRTLGGTTLRLRTENGKLRIGRASIVFGDQMARNGVVHVVYPLPISMPSDR